MVEPPSSSSNIKQINELLLNLRGSLTSYRSNSHPHLLKVMAEAPSMAMGAIYQSLAHSTGSLYENATSAQQQLAITAQAATNQGVIQVYSVDTMAGAVATSKLAQSDIPDNMLSLLTSLRAVTSPMPQQQF